jgi:hypothetical protein
MARAKSSPDVKSVDEVTQSLIGTLNKSGNGSDAYLQDDHKLRTNGLRIPHLAFQWLVGGVDILPMQRCIGISGIPKSFKSTLNIELGNWFLKAGGLHVAIDNEGKTSAEMLRAMTAYDPEVAALATKRRVFKETGSVEQWQNIVTDAVKMARKTADRPKGQRIPIYVSIDSLNGKSSESQQEKLMQEGSAEDRGYPLDAMKISRFFKGLSLLGTTMDLGYVQHLMQDIGAQSHNGPVMKEAGAVIASYMSSVQLRVSKGKALPTKATHFSAPQVGPPIEGYTLWITTERSCLGPDKRVLPVDILWQYVEKPDGGVDQIMWYDWDGALGSLLVNTQYAEKGYTKYEKDRLAAALKFSQPKTNKINCQELGLAEASLSEFGKMIRTTPEVLTKLTKYFNIVSYPDVQEADLNLVEVKEDEADD